MKKCHLYAATVALLLTGSASHGRDLPGGLAGRRVHQTTVRNDAIKAELEKMLEQDQELRRRADEVEEKHGSKSKELEELWEKQREIDKKNLARLEQIIKVNGWPRKSVVGSTASLAAFLILQHADYEYQKKYFPLVNEALKKGEIEPSRVALLEDRILVREGKEQIYGTQLKRNETTGKYELSPIKDEENLDKRRAAVGLSPIAEYLKTFGLEYVPPKKKQQ
ncbi:MAG TPA: DUF6624 domain-containing protein [Blastocatellia bacterium]|nr:DUF6624 domain-containing protein [Blastocatellia bacterium]